MSNLHDFHKDHPKRGEQYAAHNLAAGGDLNIKEINQTIVNNPSHSLTAEERTEKDFRKKLLTVDNPFRNKQEKIDRPAVDTNIENIFEQWEDGQRLLILGNSGAGKTITLLQLAKKFYDSANENVLEKPLPAVFHLSSWQFGQSIDEWLIQQLDSKYGFPQKEAENWVKNRNLFLFLDGFDQVNTEYQQECVEEINKFGASNIIVCSRIQQYETLPRDVRLYIDRAVYIKSLTPIQINKYLETLNKSDLKKVLDEDRELLKLAKIPFWLDIITEIQENLPRKGSSEQRKKKLFDEYIEKTFQKFVHKFDKTQQSKYDQSKVLKWLTWLAAKSKSVFLIEEMQPSWLTKEQKKLYLIATLCNGMLLGLLFGIPYGVIIDSYFSSLWEDSLNFPKEGIFLGISAGIILGTAAQYFLKVHKLQIKTHKEVILSWGKVRNILSKSFKRSIYESIGVGLLVFLFCLLIIPLLIQLSFMSDSFLE